MGERPILFSDSMVRAILEGRKTETRRVAKPQPRRGLYGDGRPIEHVAAGQISRLYHVWEPKPGEVIPLTEGCRYRWQERCPYGEPGDLLYVREAWAAHCGWEDTKPSQIEPEPVWYREKSPKGWESWDRGRWRPSIYMPKWAARIWLRVAEIRIERLTQITVGGALAEGVDVADVKHEGPEVSGWHALERFERLWNSINAERGYPWADDPWVWVVRFEVVSTTGRPT